MGRRNSYEWLIYVHGANGSGKSTLARTIITCSGGAKQEKHASGAMVTRTVKGRCTLIGKYSTATGGVDTVHPYALAPKTAMAEINTERHVFMEGLMTPGIETLTKLRDFVWRREGGVMYIHLDVPLDVCIANVQARRDRRGNAKPFDPRNVIAKHQGARRWAERLDEAKLPIYQLDWKTARDEILRKFDVGPRFATGLLD